MDKGLTVPKWVLIVRQKIPQMTQNLFALFVCPSPKVWDFYEKRFHWASVVRGILDRNFKSNLTSNTAQVQIILLRFEIQFVL